MELILFQLFVSLYLKTIFQVCITSSHELRENDMVITIVII